MNLSFGNGGWVRVEDIGLPGPLYARLQPDDRRRWRVRDLFIEGDAPLTADLLRKIPINVIEVEAQADTEDLVARAAVPGPDLGLLASHYATTFGAKPEHWVAQSWRAQFPDSGVERPSRPRRRRTAPAAVRQPLTAPDRLDDEFFTVLAHAYRDVVSSGAWPAPTLAEEAGVSPKTVRRWILEARKRGHLPPGTQGKVG